MEDADKGALLKGLSIIFEFSYNGLLAEYLSINALATEVDFINYISENQLKRLNDLKPQIDFFFDNNITQDDEYQNVLRRDEFWLLTEYQKYLNRKVFELTQKTSFQPIIESPFSVLEWATIFYYADETKLLSESRLLKTRLEQFMSKHQVNTTPVNFKNSYYEAKRRINEKNDYPINKLELIIPFLKENYKQTVTKVENDIIFLEENNPEY